MEEFVVDNGVSTGSMSRLSSFRDDSRLLIDSNKGRVR